MTSWKPAKSERYFYVGDNGMVNFTFWENDEVDYDYYKFGNCFYTEEEAKKALEKVKELLLSLHGENKKVIVTMGNVNHYFYGEEAEALFEYLNKNINAEPKEEIKGIISDIPKWIIDGIFNEYRWAVDKRPKFPDNEFEQLCIIQEEFGEAVQALNNLKHHQQGYSYKIYGELFHTIVTCIRTIDTMAKNESKE